MLLPLQEHHHESSVSLLTDCWVAHHDQQTGQHGFALRGKAGLTYHGLPSPQNGMMQTALVNRLNYTMQIVDISSAYSCDTLIT